MGTWMWWERNRRYGVALSAQRIRPHEKGSVLAEEEGFRWGVAALMRFVGVWGVVGLEDSAPPYEEKG